MTDTKANAKFIIEPLDPSKHNRAAFSCGVEQVDNFFKRTANKLARAGNLRVHVLTEPDGSIIGFYALNAHSIHYANLPETFKRDRPGHGTIPAAFISMIGVDSHYQGQGYGGDLLVDCLRRIARAAEAVGIRVVLLDVLDCGSPNEVERRIELYSSYGFTSLPTQKLRMFLPLSNVEALFTAE
ncbi:GNAT family N-acetyltransferase [Novosphingobium sp. 1949]|uniref:GNAT family N-acetyltransferase n=1 Tax=Novosphingobium organovorum TaxID=2930092 RepID=A0ABT0BEU3_9SPHN|nr:GNAT family N-acetyltransferase [Novosphingobium organovorum]MCJ2183574.1 GNAT family N-acetyltransferase [Novosphingobium organovorum]